MSSKQPNRSVSGEWLGNYYYANSGQPFGFEAVFIESNGGVEGHILDDGYLGEARVSGSFSCPQLSFTKVYRATSPVRYTGTLSDDGNCLSGTWQIDPTCHGTWTAYRQSTDDNEDDMLIENEEDIEVERPMVAPAKVR